MKATLSSTKKRINPKKVSDAVLDTLVRRYVRLISAGYCKRCKRYCGDLIEVSHLYKRRRKTVRWDLCNVNGLCPTCHQEIDNDQLKLVSFMYDIMSQKEIGTLQDLANQTIKTHPIDRESIRDTLKEKIGRLENEN